MATTFPCPHCGQTYPVKPVLIGKVVRCTGCKNAFRLREDGVADAVTLAAEAPAPTAAVAAAPPVPASPAPESPRPSTESIRSPARRLAADEAKAREIKARMEEARKAMAADLNQAAGKALQSDAAKMKDEEEASSSSKRSASSNRQRAVGGDQGAGKRLIGPAVLTGEGEREAANQRRWLIGALVAVALLAVGGWLLTLDGPRTAVIEGFLEPLPADKNVYGTRDAALAERGWLSAGSGAVAPFIDLGKIRWDAVRTLTPATYGAILARLAGQVRVGTCWVAAKDQEKAKSIAAAPGKDPLEKRLSAARIAALAWTGIAKELGNAGLDDRVIEVLRLVLTGDPAPGAKDLRPGLLAGTATWELLPLSGTGGSVLIDLGGSYRVKPAAWEGVLLREPGSPWRFVRLAPLKP